MSLNYFAGKLLRYGKVSFKYYGLCSSKKIYYSSGRVFQGLLNIFYWYLPSYSSRYFTTTPFTVSNMRQTPLWKLTKQVQIQLKLPKFLWIWLVWFKFAQVSLVRKNITSWKIWADDKTRDDLKLGIDFFLENSLERKNWNVHYLSVSSRWLPINRKKSIAVVADF